MNAARARNRNIPRPSGVPAVVKKVASRRGGMAAVAEHYFLSQVAAAGNIADLRSLHHGRHKAHAQKEGERDRTRTTEPSSGKGTCKRATKHTIHVMTPGGSPSSHHTSELLEPHNSQQ